jgi:hypothetical protein
VRQDIVNLFGTQNLTLNRFFHHLPDDINAAFDKFFIGIHKNNVEPFLGELLSNAAAHIACTDNRNFMNL